MMLELSWVGALCPIVIMFGIKIQNYLNGRIYKIDKARKKLADKRAKKVSEIIEGCKNIKFNAWEKIVLGICLKIRGEEKPKIGAIITLLGIQQGVAITIPTLCGLVCFSVHSTFVGSLSLSQTYSLLLLFNMLLRPLRLLINTMSKLKLAKIGT